MTALYAFSADPITYGHINIVERIVKTFGSCLVVIGKNPTKKYLFNIDERKNLVERALSHLPTVTVIARDGMIIDYAREQGIKVIIKGIRNATDLDYEHTLHQVGVSQQMGIDTHLLFADPHLAHVSSSVVKAIQSEYGLIHQYVPPVVKVALEARISNQVIIGITGSIASGKSTLAKKLVQEGNSQLFDVHHVDMDKLAHDILNGHNIGVPLYQELVSKLCKLLGDQILVDGVLDRKQIADVIFSQPSLREGLNELLSLPMTIYLRKTLKDLEGVILLEGALLPDLNLLHLCNYRCILCCGVSEQEQLRRLVNDRKYSKQDALTRVSSQLNTRQKTESIVKAIEKHNYGRIWFNYSDNPITLATLINDIKEINELPEIYD